MTERLYYTSDATEGRAGTGAARPKPTAAMPLSWTRPVSPAGRRATGRPRLIDGIAVEGGGARRQRQRTLSHNRRRLRGDDSWMTLPGVRIRGCTCGTSDRPGGRTRRLASHQSAPLASRRADNFRHRARHRRSASALLATIAGWQAENLPRHLAL